MVLDRRLSAKQAVLILMPTKTLKNRCFKAQPVRRQDWGECRKDKEKMSRRRYPWVSRTIVFSRHSTATRAVGSSCNGHQIAQLLSIEYTSGPTTTPIY